MIRFLPLCLALFAAPALAADDGLGDTTHGEMLFQENCATCHGSDATGSGPMAGALSRTPRDLTTLSVDGAFPLADVVRMIDGRDLLSHGGPMPLFGNLLTEKSAVVDDPAGNPVFTSQSVLDIVSWLTTIQ